jgi:hypothetical protein
MEAVNLFQWMPTTEQMRFNLVVAWETPDFEVGNFCLQLTTVFQLLRWHGDVTSNHYVMLA